MALKTIHFETKLSIKKDMYLRRRIYLFIQRHVFIYSIQKRKE